MSFVQSHRDGHWGNGKPEMDRLDKIKFDCRRHREYFHISLLWICRPRHTERHRCYVEVLKVISSLKVLRSHSQTSIGATNSFQTSPRDAECDNANV